MTPSDDHQAAGPRSGAIQAPDEDLTERQLVPGTQVRSYKIIRLLRTGGTGRIYLALDLASGERVAIKVPLRAAAQESAAAKAPDSFEARLLARFRHSNAVKLKEVLEDAGERYLVLEYVEGMDLETFLARAGSRLEERALQDLLGPIASAVEALHQAGFLHRDLKPENLRIRANGEPVLIDFGAALPLEPGLGGRHASSSLTHGYAAPELYSDDLPEGPWSDLYSLAAIAYRAIAGHPPPPATERLAGRPMTPAAAVGQGRYSPSFLAAIDAALALEASARPSSAARFAEMISALRREAGEGGPVAQEFSPQGSSKTAPMAAEPPHQAADPYPPTVEVRRKPLKPLPPPAERSAAIHPVAAPPRASRAPWILLLLLLLGSAAAGAWFGWPYYLRNIKDTWLVAANGEGDTNSIAAALAQAKAGATIQVAPAIYAESLIVARPVTLTFSGEPGEAAVIVPEADSCLLVTADQVEISGFTFRRQPAEDTSTSTPLPCIDISGSAVRIADIEVNTAAGTGILIQDGASATLQGVTVLESAGDGIVFSEGASGSLADSTVLRSGGIGIAVLEGAAPEISANTVAESGASGVLYARGARGRFVENAVAASGHSGIEIASAAAPDIEGNTIAASGQAGIYLHDQGGGKIEANEIAGSGFTGLLVASGAPVEIRDNRVEGSGEHGILLLRSSRAMVSGNRVEDNAGYGIGIEKGAMVELKDNQAEGNKDPQIQRDGEGRVLAGPATDPSASTGASTGAEAGEKEE